MMMVCVVCGTSFRCSTSGCSEYTIVLKSFAEPSRRIPTRSGAKPTPSPQPTWKRKSYPAVAACLLVVLGRTVL